MQPCHHGHQGFEIGTVRCQRIAERQRLRITQTEPQGSQRRRDLFDQRRGSQSARVDFAAVGPARGDDAGFGAETAQRTHPLDHAQ
jgi:hypothetical protein